MTAPGSALPFRKDLRPEGDRVERSDEEAGLGDEVAELRARLARQEAELTELRRHVAAMGASLSGRQDTLELAAHDAATLGAETAERGAYLRMTQRLRRMVERVVPSDARLVVVGKGLEELIHTIGRQAQHLGEAPDGSYPCFHPHSSLAAIAQLEAARWRGVDYLAIPATALWWLEHYPEFAAHLERRYVLAQRDEETGAIWSVGDRSPWREVEDLLDACAAVLGRRPAVLDCHTGSDLAARFPECAVFSPVEDGPRLPHVDSSIDVVAVAAADEVVVAEARRVARAAVLRAGTGPGAGPGILWQARDLGEAAVGASLVVHVPDGHPLRPAYLGRLLDSLPAAFSGEILLPTDADTDVTHRLGAARGKQVRTRVLRQRAGSRARDQLSHAVEAASEEQVVLLDARACPLPGWLPPLLRVLRHHPAVGVASGMLVGPDGRLLQAGGQLSGGTAPVSVGAGDYVLTAPRYNHVRPVDFCSSVLLATRRDLFLAAGGLDDGDDLMCSGLGYCTRVTAMGRTVLYQPETIAVVCPDG